MTREEHLNNKYNQTDYDLQLHTLKRRRAESNYRMAQRRAKIAKLLLVLSWISGIIAAVSVSALDSEGYSALYIFILSITITFLLVLTRDKLNDYA